MDVFTFTPYEGSQGEMSPRVLRAQFGDGYPQETGDGINALMRTWNLVFDPIHGTTGSTNLNAIDAFLKTQKGYIKFLWTQPTPFDTEGQLIWICPSWNYIFNQGQCRGLRCMFLQRPL